MTITGNLQYLGHTVLTIVLLGATAIIVTNMYLVVQSAENMAIARQAEEKTHEARNEIVRISAGKTKREAIKEIAMSHLVVAEQVAVSASR